MFRDDINYVLITTFITTIWLLKEITAKFINTNELSRSLCNSSGVPTKRTPILCCLMLYTPSGLIWNHTIYLQSLCFAWCIMHLLPLLLIIGGTYDHMDEKGFSRDTLKHGEMLLH